MPALAAHRPIPASRSLSRPPTRRRAAAPLTAGLALLAYGVIALALFSTVVAHLATAFAGDLGDPPSQAWILAWDVHALRTNPAHLYEAPIFYPFHDVLAYQDTLLGLLPLAAPVLLLSGNAVLTYNVMFLLSFALCAWGAYLLARLLVGDTRAAFVAGLVYGFSPYRMVHLYHLNLLSGMWIPFALLCWERVRRGRRRYWLGVGLFFALQALSALYYAAFLAVALVVLLAVHLRRARRGHLDPATAWGPHAAEPLLPHPRVRRWGSSARRAQCLRGGQTTPTAVGSKASPAIGPPIARRGSLRHRSARGLPCDRSRRFRVLPTSAAAPVLLRDALVTAGSCALALLPFIA